MIFAMFYSKCASSSSFFSALLLLIAFILTSGDSAYATKKISQTRRKDFQTKGFIKSIKSKQANTLREFSRGMQILKSVKKSGEIKKLAAKIKAIPYIREEVEWRKNKNFDRSADYSVKRWVRILDGIDETYDVYFSEDGDFAMDKISNRTSDGSIIKEFGPINRFRFARKIGKTSSNDQLIAAIVESTKLEKIPFGKIRSEKAYWVRENTRFFNNL